MWKPAIPDPCSASRAFASMCAISLPGCVKVRSAGELVASHCGINLIDPDSDPIVPTMHNLVETSEGECEFSEEAQWGEELLLKFWRDGVPAYRRDLEEEDVHGERQGSLDQFGHPARSVVDVPFTCGTLLTPVNRQSLALPRLLQSSSAPELVPYVPRPFASIGYA